MTHDEFVNALRDEVENRRITDSQMKDLLEQKVLFDRNKPTLKAEFSGRIVGFVADGQRSADNVHELLDQAKAYFPPRMIYFEPIGFKLF